MRNANFSTAQINKLLSLWTTGNVRRKKSNASPRNTTLKLMELKRAQEALITFKESMKRTFNRWNGALSAEQAKNLLKEN